METQHPNLPLTKVEPATDLTLRDQNYLMSAKERGVMATLLRELGAQTVVELGVNDGRGAEVMLQAVPTIRRYVGVDVPPGYTTALSVQQAEIPETPGLYALDDPRFELIVRPRGTLSLNFGDLPTCDATLIDGDHGREAVLWDTDLAVYHTRPGGLIIWHDYYLAEQPSTKNPLDVTAVLNELFAKGWPIRHVEGTWLAIMTR